MSPAVTESRRKQSLKALAVANAIKAERRKLRAELKAGRHNPIRLLASPPEFLRGMKLGAFLIALPGMGPTRVASALHRSGLEPYGLVGELSAQEALALALQLRANHSVALRRAGR